MCHSTKAVAADGIDQDPLLLQRGNDCRGGKAVTDHIENHDIRIDIVRVDSDRRNLVQPSCQLLSVVVVHFQSSDMVFEGIDAGSGEDAGLPHRATIHSAQPFGFIEECQVIHHQ